MTEVTDASVLCPEAEGWTTLLMRRTNNSSPYASYSSFLTVRAKLPIAVVNIRWMMSLCVVLKPKVCPMVSFNLHRYCAHSGHQDLERFCLFRFCMIRYVNVWWCCCRVLGVQVQQKHSAGVALHVSRQWGLYDRWKVCELCKKEEVTVCCPSRWHPMLGKRWWRAARHDGVQ